MNLIQRLRNLWRLTACDFGDQPVSPAAILWQASQIAQQSARLARLEKQLLFVIDPTARPPSKGPRPMLVCNCSLAGTAACQSCPNALRQQFEDLPSSLPERSVAVPDWAWRQTQVEVNRLREEVDMLKKALYDELMSRLTAVRPAPVNLTDLEGDTNHD